MTTTTTTSPQPEQGQMVSVRSRNWMVTDVSTSTLLPQSTGFATPDQLDSFLDAVRLDVASQHDGFTIPTNMRVPAASVIHRLFDAEPMTDGDGEECFSHWESQGKPLGRRAVVVEARKVPDRVIAIVQPVEAIKKKREDSKSVLWE